MGDAVGDAVHDPHMTGHVFETAELAHSLEKWLWQISGSCTP